ncbi:MAG TPA: acetolactate synthase large subunit [Parvularculaceae bacterium]|nr:acetolactate synthase large subunit [Parvularculaceae bacterium]
MNGAEALISTLSKAGVEVCFANPGTSEMQLVAAIDQHPEMRAVLCLFEGVVTGAADGYGRMADKPAATLLHLGPGLGNGVANLHDARRARSPIHNIVGDHAVDHLKFNAPLTSDIVGVATPVSDAVLTSTSADHLAELGAVGFATALDYPGKVVTLIAPADHAWTEAKGPAAVVERAPAPKASASAIDAACEALKNSDGPAALFMGGMALREDALEQAGRIAAATGARLLCETFMARLQRGEGRVPVERLPYFGEMAADYLKDFRTLIMVGAKPPVAFFAYPGKPGWLSPEGANIVTLAEPREDAKTALKALADALDAPAEHGKAQARFAPPAPTGKLDAAGIGAVLTELMPDDAIVSDEAATAGLAIFPMTMGAPRHDWITTTGGAIGQGLPAGIGAAIACPDRKTICLQADGSGMYTVQSLWTMARENLDILTIIINNGSYAILNIELMRVGVANPGPKALSLLDLTHPNLQWTAIAEGMGVRAARAETVSEFRAAFRDALEQKGPRLIEAVI